MAPKQTVNAKAAMAKAIAKAKLMPNTKAKPQPTSKSHQWVVLRQWERKGHTTNGFV